MRPNAERRLKILTAAGFRKETVFSSRAGGGTNIHDGTSRAFAYPEPVRLFQADTE